MRRNIAFTTANRTRHTRELVQRCIRQASRVSYFNIVQVSVQKIHKLPVINNNTKLIIPNITTNIQLLKLRSKGFFICDVITTEQPYKNCDDLDHIFSLSDFHGDLIYLERYIVSLFSSYNFTPKERFIREKILS